MIEQGPADDFGKHEVVHMAHILHEMFFTHVQDHQAVCEDEEICAAVGEVGAALWNFYQLVGRKF